MRCPLCPNSVLVASHRHGIEVDHCPTCRGVWLDRGELDHLVGSVAERLGPPAPGSTAAAPAGGLPPMPPPAPGPARREHDDGRERDERDRRRRKKRKHSVLDLLEEVLDF